MKKILSTVTSVSDLYSKYPIGGESGFFAFVRGEQKFYEWKDDQWEEVLFTDTLIIASWLQVFENGIYNITDNSTDTPTELTGSLKLIVFTDYVGKQTKVVQSADKAYYLVSGEVFLLWSVTSPQQEATPQQKYIPEYKGSLPAVQTVEQLYIDYPMGGEFGWYAFVGANKTFAYWDEDLEIWKLLTAGDKTSQLQNDGADGVHPFITVEDVDLSPYQTITDPTLETAAQTIPSAINEVRGIAIGANKAFVFDTEAAMEAWLLIPENVSLLITGNLLLIRELTVPDYWWDGTQALELEVKIDLTNYYTKLEIDQLLGDKSDIGHDHTGEEINPDTVILDKQYTNLTMVDLPVGAIFYNVDQLCWLLKLSDVNYYNFGEELPMLCKNGDVTTHLEGTPVYISGGSGQFAVMMITDSTIGKCNAIATQDVLTTGSGRGYYCFFGQVRQFNYANVIKSTDNENTWVDGVSLYLCSELGKYSTTKEDAPSKSIKIGTITNRNGANITIIFTPEPCISIDGLCDVDGNLADISDTDLLLAKETSTGIWKKLSFTNFKTFITTNWSLIWAKEQSFTLGIKTDIIKKLNGSGLFALQDGGTIWHVTKWFTPTVASTARSVGTLVTLTGSTQLTAAMIGGKFGFGDDKRVILTVPTSNTCTVDSAFSQDYVGVDAASWGVYGIDRIVINGDVYYYGSSGQLYFRTDVKGVITYLPASANLINGFSMGRNNTFGWHKYDGLGNFGNDISFGRTSTGCAEVNSGSFGLLRDLIMRNLKVGTIYQTQLNTATSGGSISSISVQHTTNFPATGTFILGTTTIAYTSKTATSLVFTAQVVPAYAIGTQVLVTSAGDYVEIGENGVKLFGTATVYEDLNFAPNSSGGAAVTLPDYVTINNVTHREFTSANNQKCGDSHEIPHSYKLGSTLAPHAHIFLKAGESAGTTGVTFTLYWELRQSAGVTSGSTTLTATSAELTANPTKFNLYDSAFAGAAELGSQLALTIARTGGDAGDIVLTTYGVHFEIDAMGSNLIDTK